MKKRDKNRYDDDGRTIADMSGIERPNLFLPRIPSEERKARETEQLENEKRGERPWENNSVSREERRWVLLGTMKAVALIALPYLVGFALLIWIMTLVFR